MNDLTLLNFAAKRLDSSQYELGQALGYLIKAGGTPVKADVLKGRFYVSRSGWGLLSVPNAVVRGLFDAMNVPGAELPLDEDGTLNAHVTVLRPEDIEQIGGADRISERGNEYGWQLGQIHEVEPFGWPEMEKVWFVRVESPELEKLRKSYGLSALPTKNGVELPFHATVGRRRRGVLRENDIRKDPPPAPALRQVSPVSSTQLVRT